MTDLSTWIWVVAAVLWVVVKVLPRIFRARSNQQPSSMPPARRHRVPTIGEHDHPVEIAPDPIEPK